MMKSQTGEATGTFHMENFRRRSRYAAVFAVLAAALFAILILNINTGTTNIPVSRILKIVFLHNECSFSLCADGCPPALILSHGL